MEKGGALFPQVGRLSIPSRALLWIERFGDMNPGANAMHFITFSRTLGSQGTVIAKRVAEAMGYAFNDTEAIDRVAGVMGFSASVKELDGKAPSFFQPWFFGISSLTAFGMMGSVLYFHESVHWYNWFGAIISVVGCVLIAL